MSLLTVMFGPSGSGKSTWVKESCPGHVVLSADSQFMEAGQYKWSQDKMQGAHGWCLRTFMEHMMLEPQPDLVIDNAFSHQNSALPYVACGLAMGYQVRPICMVPPEGWGLATAAAAYRRSQHGTPASKVRDSAESLMLTLRKWPAYWPAPILVDPFRALE
jgi:hypothetical protein